MAPVAGPSPESTDIDLTWRLAAPIGVCLLASAGIALERLHTYLAGMPSEVKVLSFPSTALGPAIAAAALGSSLRYIRRLYRDLFRSAALPTKQNSGEYKLAALLYYLSRPLIAISIAVFVVVGSAAGFLSLVSRDTLVDGRGILVVSSICGLAGYAVGRLIDALDRSSARMAEVFERTIQERLGK